MASKETKTWSTNSRRWTGKPQTHEVGNPDHGRGTHSRCARCVDAALGTPRQSVHLARSICNLAFGALGMIDDYSKVSANSAKGIRAKPKFLIGLLIGGIAGYAAMLIHPEGMSGALALPFFKSFLINLGFVFIPFSMIVIVGSANAVNLTDGLDGLAIVPIMVAAGALGIIAYAVGRVDFTEYLDVHYVPGTGELLVVAGGIIGGGLGFLWYNAPPAAVFMGDTGSLALGGAVVRSRWRPSTKSC